MKWKDKWTNNKLSGMSICFSVTKFHSMFIHVYCKILCVEFRNGIYFQRESDFENILLFSSPFLTNIRLIAIVTSQERNRFRKSHHCGSSGRKRRERKSKIERGRTERVSGMRGMIADGRSCIGFEGPGAELVRTNDYN